MSRLQQLFQRKPRRVLNIYLTAGYPALTSTLPLMRVLQENGADIIELGMPYSDPLADGEVIQQSSSAALANGMNMRVLFGQLKEMRKQISVPVILMGYMNPVMQYGFEQFCADASAVGIDGLILPDMPEHEFEQHYASIIRRHHLEFIFLVTPETAEERVKKLDRLSSGFLYAVSSSSTTGGQTNFEAVTAYLQRLQTYGLVNPVLLGFGIKDKASFKAATAYSNGAIIGSAFIKALQDAEDAEAAARQFLQQVLH